MKTISHKIAAFLTTAAFLSQTTAVFAQSVGLSEVTDNIVKSSASTPDLISVAAYTGGIGMGVTGVYKLKQHVDQPAQQPMKDGLVRLAGGGGLLALPAVTTAMTDTIDGDGPSTATGPDAIDFDALEY